jgi:hypothetical protein
VRTLTCTFIKTQHNQGTSHQQYHYLYTGARPVQSGDWAVVHNGNEFGIVRIDRVRPGIHDKVTKHVLALITQEDYLNYQQANRQIDEHRRIFDQLDYMLEQDKQLDRYKDLASRNPEAAELLKKATVWQGEVLDHKPFSFGDGNADSGSATVDQTKDTRVTREDINATRPAATVSGDANGSR